jgi:hypothetical protein
MIKLMALQWVVLLDVRFSQTFFLSFHEKEWLDNCSDSFKPIFPAAMLMTRLYCLTHVIILFLSLITLTQTSQN